MILVTLNMSSANAFNLVKAKILSFGGKELNLRHVIPTTPDRGLLKKIVGKGKNVGNQHYLFFLQCFLHFPKQLYIFQSHSFCHLHML